MAVTNPLNDMDLQEIKSALSGLEDAESLVRMGSQAGLDLGDYPQRIREAKDKLLRVKQTFFPNS